MASQTPSNASGASRWFAALAFAFASAGAAIAQADPPGRAAALSHTEGTVAFAPAGETEWGDAALNRPITRGDRLWTDPGARAEVHLGSAALRMDGKTFLEVVALDEDVLQASLNEGVVDARVRQLDGGENFEIDTPQLAFRPVQPGDYRIDVDPVTGTTRVTVRNGSATVQGAAGGTMQLQAGQQVAFAGRNLEQVPQATLVEDAFDRWAQGRSRAEDASVTARYVPREVVGYQQLDANGTWSVDNNYGAVWYPRVTVADWAPYRYGRWEWVEPWGWTWMDDAPWGFAPFHYGRWAMIESRWAWVPGRIDRRPVYSPALVVFAGAGSAWAARGNGVAWYPLAPGEAWRPVYRASAGYLRNVNRNIVAGAGYNGGYVHQRRSDAITSVRAEDFHRGRVNTHWSRVNPGDLGRSQAATQSDLPRPQRQNESARPVQPAAQPRPQGVMNAFAVRPWQPQVQAPQQRIESEPRRQWQAPWQQQRQAAQAVQSAQAEQQRAWRDQQARQAHQQQQQAWQQDQRAQPRAQQPYPQQQVMPGGWSGVQRGEARGVARGEVRVQPQQQPQPPQQGRWQQRQQRDERAAGENEGRGRGHRFN